VEDPGLYKPFEMLGADYRKWKLKMPQGNIRQPSQATRRFLQPSVARGDEHPSSMFSARAGESFQSQGESDHKNTEERVNEAVY
jgi:hypothetical protein